MSTQKADSVGCPAHGQFTTDRGDRGYYRHVSRVLCVLESYEDCLGCPNGEGVLVLRTADNQRTCPVIEAAHGIQSRTSSTHRDDPCFQADIQRAQDQDLPYDFVDLNTCLFTRPFLHCPSCRFRQRKEELHGQGDSR